MITDVTVTPSTAARASRCLRPKAPAPATAIRTGLVLFQAGGAGGPQHDGPDRGVGRGDMAAAAKLLDLGAHGATHDQLPDHLDPLRARLTHVLHARQPCQAPS